MTSKIVSSLVKCFLDDSPCQFPALSEGSFLLGERYSFQLAYMPERDAPDVEELYLRVSGPLAEAISASRVMNVPVILPVTDEHDGDYLRTSPGLYPDLLLPVREGDAIPAVRGQCAALWFDVETSDAALCGEHTMRLSLTNESGEERVSESVRLRLIPAELPKQTLKYTQWFHADCLANYYHVPAFSEEHWRIMENFVRKAVSGGVTMILTPVLTPPLDTKVGGERLTVQLVDVERKNGAYSFQTGKLERFIQMCVKAGIQDFEISHFFTQWGAACAPKVMGVEDGVEKRFFGWETPSGDPEYIRFLHALIPRVLKVFSSFGLHDRVYFHISDEPREKHLPAYAAASRAIKPLLEGRPVMDAVSEYAFLESELVEMAIPSTSRIQPFLDAHVENLWTYYCCTGRKGVSNRFVAMPSLRNRVLGLQMYLYDIRGFLHWGYNFYNNRLSRTAVNPFLTTDGDCMTEAGDQFSVYPAQDGTALESIRFAVFRQALQDMRACALLETLEGRDAVQKIITKAQPVTFSQYPRRDEWLISTREQINREIEKRLAR